MLSPRAVARAAAAAASPASPSPPSPSPAVPDSPGRGFGRTGVGGGGPVAGTKRACATVGAIVLLLVYLIQFEDSLLRVAARGVARLTLLPANEVVNPLALAAADVDADWDESQGGGGAVAGASGDDAGGNGTAAAGSGGGGGDGRTLSAWGPLSLQEQPTGLHCLSAVEALRPETRRRTVGETLREACLCVRRGGDAPSSFVLPLLWWAGARMTAYSNWANGARRMLDGEFTWRYGHILERPVESYPDVFANRGRLAWESGMLFTPTYFLSGRFAVNLSTSDACTLLLQPAYSVLSPEASEAVWGERFAIAGIRPLPSSFYAAFARGGGGSGGGGGVGKGLIGTAAGGGSGGATAATLAAMAGYHESLPSPFYAEAMARARELSAPGPLNAARGGQGALPWIARGAWVSPAALEAGMKDMSNDLARGGHNGARTHVYTPLSSVVVPRFYPDIFHEMGLMRLAVVPPNATNIRDWAFVPGVVHNVTHYVVTYVGVYFRKEHSAVLRLTRVKPRGHAGEVASAAAAVRASVSDALRALPAPGTSASGGGVGGEGGGGGAVPTPPTTAASSATASPMPSARSPEFDGWIAERQLTGVSVKACKIMPTPSASRPPSPTPVAGADFPSAMRVDEYMPITHRWAANVYHLYGETVTRALGVYPFVDHSRGFIAGDDGLVRGLRLLGRWRVRDLSIDRASSPELVAARSLHLVDLMMCQMTSANELLLLREALRRALGLPPPPLGYLRAPIVRDPRVVGARLRRAAAARGGAGAALPTPAPSARKRYHCAPAFYRRPHVLFIRRRASRLFVNYHSLLSALQSTGAVITIFDEAALPPPKETFGLFARADIIIGVHGAGLTNVIASSPGAAVFEVLPANFAGLHYAEYSIVMGLEYHRWEVPPILPPSPSPAPAGHEPRPHEGRTVKDKDANVAAPLGDLMKAVCRYVSKRFGVGDADWVAAGLPVPNVTAAEAGDGDETEAAAPVAGGGGGRTVTAGRGAGGKSWAPAKRAGGGGKAPPAPPKRGN
jgi:hypothetical protein